MIEQLFEVATEFKFDVGQALLSTNALQQAVDGVSNSASGAMKSLGFLAGGLVAHMGLGSGGLLSVLTKAVQISQAFDTNVLNFSNIISSNTKFLAGNIDTFNDRLITSRMLLDKVSDAAIQVGLPASELGQLTQRIAAPLATHQKLGTDFEGAISMSKNLMIGAQMTGLHPQVAGESLLRALTDNMPLQGKLFTRLMGTAPFQDAHIKSQSQLQHMAPAKKIDLLANALKALGADADSVNYRLGRLDVQFTILKNQIEVVLEPIGAVIQKSFSKVIQIATTYLSANGKRIGDAIAKLFGNILSDPKELVTSLMQLKALKSDVRKALEFSSLIGGLKFLQMSLARIGFTFDGGLVRYLMKSIGKEIATAFSMLVPYILPALSAIWTGFVYLREAMFAVLPEFGAFLFLFQVISRARATAKLSDVGDTFELFPGFADMVVKLKTAIENIMMPFQMAVKFWGDLISPLFQTSTLAKILVGILDPFVNVLGAMGFVVLSVLGVMTGFMDMIIGFVLDVINLRNPFKNMADNFNGGVDAFIKENQARLGGDGMQVTSNHVTNVGKIEARFDMREQLEPDRIAFAVTEHLKDLAGNPKQARGGSLNGPFGAGSIYNAATGGQ